MKNTVDYVKLAEERAATIAALERRLADLEAACAGGVPGIRRELSCLRDTVLEERSAFSGFVAGLMEAVGEGGAGVGARVCRDRAEDAERLERLGAQLEAKAEARAALEAEVEAYKQQVSGRGLLASDATAQAI